MKPDVCRKIVMNSLKLEDLLSQILFAVMLIQHVQLIEQGMLVLRAATCAAATGD